MLLEFSLLIYSWPQAVKVGSLEHSCHMEDIRSWAGLGLNGRGSFAAYRVLVTGGIWATTAAPPVASARPVVKCLRQRESTPYPRLALLHASICELCLPQPPFFLFWLVVCPVAILAFAAAHPTPCFRSCDRGCVPAQARPQRLEGPALRAVRGCVDRGWVRAGEVERGVHEGGHSARVMP